MLRLDTYKLYAAMRYVDCRLATHQAVLMQCDWSHLPMYIVLALQSQVVELVLSWVEAEGSGESCDITSFY